MRMIIMGPPGVGKGTAAALLCNHYGIPHISTGNIFRELYKDQTEVGKKAKSYVDRGELVPDEITNLIVYNRLLQDDAKNGFLLDGFPRNTDQAKALDGYLAESHIKIDAVVNLKAPDELIIERIGGRRVCETCGAVYHVTNLKPKVEGICDKDGGKLIQRVDDMEATIKRRLGVYYSQTEPVIGYYEKKGAVIHIDGTGTIEAVNALIMKALGE
ncbi:MAG: adenylate kinase [Acholeplasmataceae bacterium]|nr:adenylate kinase [Acholeplasmataceae bacterium]